MKYRTIFILGLILGLSGCKSQKAEEAQLSTPSLVESVESLEDESTEVNKEVKESSGPYKDIYDELEGKEFFMGEAGSYGEAIYFYRDGYFDGMAFTGNGGHENDSLFNGKFDIVEKIDDLTYKIKLTRLDFEDLGKKEELARHGDFPLLRTFENMSVFDGGNDYIPKETPEYHILYLPYTKRSSLGENILYCFDMSLRNSSKNPDILGRYAISDGDSITFAEVIKE